MEKTVGNIDATDTLKIKTWVLRVLIHCEGCRKKVTKVIKSVEGVYKIEVDALQHKVVVTGDFDPNILIKKLCKNGKQAEILHESTTTSPKFDDMKHAKHEERRPALSSRKSKGNDKNKQENPITIEAHKNMQAEDMVEKKISSQPTNPAEKMSSGKKVHLVEEKLKALTGIGLGGVDSENNSSEARMKPNKILENGEGPNKITENGEGRINNAPLQMPEQFPPKNNVVAPANYKEVVMSSNNSSYPISNGGSSFHAPGHFPPNCNVIAPAENKEVMSSNTLSYDSYPSNNGGFAFHAPPTQQHSYAFSGPPANGYYPPPPPDYIRPQSIYHNDDYYDYDDDDKTACSMM